jgi:hypothetical protein
MSSTTSYRLSGIALIFGSVLSIVYLLIQGFFLNGNDLATITSSLSMTSSVIGFVGSVLVLLGLPGVYTRQAGQAGILGLLGFLFIWYVTLYQGVIIPFTSVTIISQITAHIVPHSVAVATTPPPAWTPFFFVSLVSQVLGILLLAIATLRASVFPRWTAWLLITTLLVGVVSFVPFFPGALSNLAGIVAGVAIAGFGFALLWPERLERKQPVPERVEAEARA